jgi:hypothetical protein
MCRFGFQKAASVGLKGDSVLIEGITHRVFQVISFGFPNVLL